MKNSSALVLVLCTLLNLLTIIATYLHVKYIHKTDIRNFKNLPDLIIDNLPDLSDNKSIIFLADKLPILGIFPFILTNRSDLFIFMYKLFSVIFFLRTLTKFFTILPSQSRTNCTNDIKNPMIYISGYCHDKIFSGHSALTLIYLLTIIDNKIINPKYNFLLIFSHSLYAVLLIVTKNHYTVDIISSYIITISIFYNLKTFI